jgi:hypothetical protein
VRCDRALPRARYTLLIQRSRTRILVGDRSRTLAEVVRALCGAGAPLRVANFDSASLRTQARLAQRCTPLHSAA